MSVLNVLVDTSVWVAHFRNANSMHINGHVGWTRLTAPSIVELAGSRGSVGWLTSPGLLDSAMFSCGVYAWSNFDKVIAIPHRIESLRLGRSATPGETCYQRFEFVGLQNNHALFDFDLFGHDGQRILQVEKYSAIVIRDGSFSHKDNDQPLSTIHHSIKGNFR